MRLALYFQRKAEIAVVLTDLAMGQMDGIALVRALRKIDPAVRVIASSGHFQKENLAVLNGLGVKVFLEKPYTPTSCCARCGWCWSRCR